MAQCGWGERTQRSVKAAVERKEVAWKVVFGLVMSLQKKDVWKFIKKEKRRLKSVYIRAERH